MATDPSTLSGTAVPPEGYRTPEQIQQLYDYSKQLMEGASKDQPITNFWQGPERMMHALAGNIARNQAGGQQMNNLALDAATRNLQNPPFSQQDPFKDVPPGTPGSGLPFPTSTSSTPSIPSAIPPIAQQPPASRPIMSQGLPQYATPFPNITGSGMPPFAGQPSMSGGIGNSPFGGSPTIMPPLMTPPPNGGTGFA